MTESVTPPLAEAQRANMTVTDSGSVLSSLGLSTTNGLGDLRNGLSSGSKVETVEAAKE